MRKSVLFSACLAVFSAALLIVPACRPKAKGRVIAEGPVKGDLQILQASPQGALEGLREADQIVVIFDQTMAPLEPLPIEDDGNLLRLEPNFPGQYRWMGTRALTFTPKVRFPFGTEIKVTVPAGLRSLDGYALAKDYVWSFRTPRPSLARSLPAHDSQQIRLESPVYLVFNQPVDADKAKDFIALAGADAEGRIHTPGFSISHPEAKNAAAADIEIPTDRILFLEPGEKLRPDFTYTVEIKEGLPAKDGPLGLEHTALLKFQTIRTFRFEGLVAADPLAPGEEINFKFTNRVRFKDLLQKAVFEPAVAIPDYYASWDHGNTELYVSLPVLPETEYTVRIPADLADEFGNALGKAETARFKTGSYPASVRMTTGHGVLEAYADPIYPLLAMNAEKVRIMGAPLSRDEIIPFLKNETIFQTNTFFQPRPSFYRLDKTMPLRLPRNKRQLVPVSLRELLKDRFGLVLLQLDTFSDEEWSHYPKAMLQVTELGITGKFSPDKDLIWVTELKTGQPVGGVDIEIRDAGNMVRWQGKTDADGKAMAPGWRAMGLKPVNEWAKPEQFVFARRGEDVAFASSEWGTGIDAWRFNIDYDWSPEPEPVRGYIFSERGIYRAGEAVHVKGILRALAKGRWTLPTIKEIDYDVTDPFQKSVQKGKAAVDDYGSFTFDLETRENAALGFYGISAKVPPLAAGSKPTVLEGSFRVEAFRPAEFEVHLRSEKEAFIFGDPFQAEIRANFLYGGAMANQSVDWTLRLNPTSFDPPGHKGFIYGAGIDLEEDHYSENSRLLAGGQAKLGADGRLSIHVPLTAEKETASVMAALEATVQSPSRKSISNRIQTLVHRGEFYLGLKPQSSFIKKSETLSVDVISVRPDGTSIADKKTTVKLIKREWRSARKAGVGGRFEWVSEKTDTEIAARDIKTGTDPVAVSFQPDKSGLYVLAAESADGRKNRIVTTTYVYVTGSDYVPWERKDDDALELVPDAESYKPGEKARILIKSPYEKAKALITVEREFVLQAQVLEIQGSVVPVEIPITADLVPNAFVSVILVQGRTSGAAVTETDDVGKPQFKIGYAKLSIDPSGKKLAVDVTPDKPNYKPREKVTVKLKVRDNKNAAAPAALTVAVVDVGVLNLIGYQTPDAFSWFYGDKPLSVQTSDSRIHIVGQRHYGDKGENAGGGGADAARATGLSEVELRANFKTTAYWNPSLRTDANGEAAFEFTLPDNLTSFRIMAVAQTKDSSFGRQESTFKVSKPLLLLPSAPRFARIGDRFEAGIVINNYSGHPGSVVLNIETQGIALRDKPDRKFDLAPNESREVLFALEAEKSGLAKLALRAMMGPDSDGLEIRIPVQVPRGTETVATFDQTTTAKEEKVTIPDALYPEESRLDVTAAASALTGLQGSLDYLANYPYLCLEQRCSGILPYIVAPALIEDFKLSPLGPKDIKALVKATLKDVFANQKEDGGFSLWTDSSIESPYASAYAVFTLKKAKDAGYEVNEERLTRAAHWLKQLLTTKVKDTPYPYKTRGWLTTQAFALYDLALLKAFDPAAAERLFKDRGQLTIFGRTMLLKAYAAGGGSAQARETLLTELLNLVKLEQSQAHFEEFDDFNLGWIYSSSARTTALILQALMETNTKHTLAPNIARWLVNQRKAGRWHSTQENFYVFYALHDFYRLFENVRPDFKAELSLAGRTILKEAFASVQKTAAGSLPLTEVKAGKEIPLRIAKTGEGTLYYGVRLTYAPKRALTARDEGFAVYKTITTTDGKPLGEIKAGQLVLVTLQVLAPQESLYVVVDDPLPAGFEAVNPTFETESEEQQRKLDGIAAAANESDYWWEGFNHIEMRDNRIALFADSLLAGVHTHRYLARALTPGTFTLPGSKAEQMYAPERFGRNDERTIKIVK
jgi:alpha-2-macroglobulin